MSNPKKEKAPIVVQISPDMANWMHPQTNEYKLRMLAQAEAAKQRYRKHKQKALFYAQAPIVMSESLTVSKNAKRIPRQKVIDHSKHEPGQRLHGLEK